MAVPAISEFIDFIIFDNTDFIKVSHETKLPNSAYTRCFFAVKVSENRLTDSRLQQFMKSISLKKLRQVVLKLYRQYKFVDLHAF